MKIKWLIPLLALSVTACEKPEPTGEPHKLPFYIYEYKDPKTGRSF
jgi:hypothetical protein